MRFQPSIHMARSRPQVASGHLGGEIWQVRDRGRNIGALIRGRSSHPFEHLALYPVAESSSHWMGGKSTRNSGNHGFFSACARGFPVKMSLHHFWSSNVRSQDKQSVPLEHVPSKRMQKSHGFSPTFKSGNKEYSEFRETKQCCWRYTYIPSYSIQFVFYPTASYSQCFPIKWLV